MRRLFATLPRPPPIKSLELRRQVLDIQAPQNRTLPNAYLELVGDALARLLSLMVIHHYKPAKPASVLAKQKVLFESNRWMAYLARHTGLTEMVSANTDLDLKSAIIRGRKPAADLFERYIGALFVEQGLGVVISWYYKLHEPIIMNIQSVIARLLSLREHEAGELVSEFYQLSIKKTSSKRFDARIVARKTKKVVAEASEKTRDRALKSVIDKAFEKLRDRYSSKISEERSKEDFHITTASPPPLSESQNLASLLVQTQKEVSKATAILQELRSEAKSHELAMQSRMQPPEEKIAVKPDDLEEASQDLDILDFDSYFTESNAAKRISSDNDRGKSTVTSIGGEMDDLSSILGEMSPTHVHSK